MRGGPWYCRDAAAPAEARLPAWPASAPAGGEPPSTWPLSQTCPALARCLAAPRRRAALQAMQGRCQTWRLAARDVWYHGGGMAAVVPPLPHAQGQASSGQQGAELACTWRLCRTVPRPRPPPIQQPAPPLWIQGRAYSTGRGGWRKRAPRRASDTQRAVRTAGECGGGGGREKKCTRWSGGQRRARVQGRRRAGGRAGRQAGGRVCGRAGDGRAGSRANHCVRSTDTTSRSRSGGDSSGGRRSARSGEPSWPQAAMVSSPRLSRTVATWPPCSRRCRGDEM